MSTPQSPEAAKRLSTAIARAALAGIHAVASRDDAGRRTLILTRGVWTREIRPEQLGQALAEVRMLELAERDG